MRSGLLIVVFILGFLSIVTSSLSEEQALRALILARRSASQNLVPTEHPNLHLPGPDSFTSVLMFMVSSSLAYSMIIFCFIGSLVSGLDIFNQALSILYLFMLNLFNFRELRSSFAARSFPFSICFGALILMTIIRIPVLFNQQATYTPFWIIDMLLVTYLSNCLYWTMIKLRNPMLKDFAASFSQGSEPPKGLILTFDDVNNAYQEALKETRLDVAVLFVDRLFKYSMSDLKHCVNFLDRALKLKLTPDLLDVLLRTMESKKFDIYGAETQNCTELTRWISAMKGLDALKAFYDNMRLFTYRPEIHLPEEIRLSILRFAMNQIKI